MPSASPGVRPAVGLIAVTDSGAVGITLSTRGTGQVGFRFDGRQFHPGSWGQGDPAGYYVNAGAGDG